MARGCVQGNQSAMKRNYDLVYKALLEYGLPERETRELSDICSFRAVAATEYFISAGDIPRKIAFVLKGLFRYLYVDASGKEFTKSLVTERNFIASYSAMAGKQPSYFFIQAMENSDVAEISYDQFLKLKETNPFWDKLHIKLLEKGFIVKEKRERDLLLLDAETRYKNFLAEFPGMEDRIHQHVIASYLGIKPESLSRIRKKLSS